MLEHDHMLEHEILNSPEETNKSLSASSSSCISSVAFWLRFCPHCLEDSSGTSTVASLSHSISPPPTPISALEDGLSDSALTV